MQYFEDFKKYGSKEIIPYFKKPSACQSYLKVELFPFLKCFTSHVSGIHLRHAELAGLVQPVVMFRDTGVYA